MNTQLLIIDPQNDFCDLPEPLCPPNPLDASGSRLRPSLPVTGAHADMRRLASWLAREGAKLDAITVTLDSHQQYDIAHPTFWQDANGNEPAPFTAISAQAVRAGEFAPRDSQARARVLPYLDALEARGAYQLMVWPVHCEVGSWGHGVHAEVLAACGQWQRLRQQAIHPVFKGLNPWTEHYSALQAEVPEPADPGTQLNADLLARLDQAQCLIIAGEASSHCVRATVIHLLQHLPAGKPERLLLMQDAMSPVAGFETVHHAFLNDMRACGVRLATSDEIRL